MCHHNDDFSDGTCHLEREKKIANCEVHRVKRHWSYNEYDKFLKSSGTEEYGMDVKNKNKRAILTIFEDK